MTTVTSRSRVLEAYYPIITTLSTYLDALLPSKAQQWTQHEDPDSFRRLLTTTIVATESPLEEIPKFDFYPPACSQSDIMDRVHGRLFKNIKGKSSNVLAFGYRMAENRDEVSKVQPGRVGISNHAINSMVISLTTGDWSLLLQRIGEGAMFHLLTSTSIFLSLGNDNFCQATGRPIYDMKQLDLVGQRVDTKRALPQDFDDREEGSKRPCTERRDKQNKSKQKNSPVNINITRNRMFYSRPDNGRRTSGLQVGLPSRHIMNRIMPRLTKPDKRHVTESARLMTKYIFPRQYGFHNVFDFEKERGAWPFRDYTIRDGEIEREGPVKTPPRVQRALPLVINLLHRHRSTNYRAILQRFCISKIESKNPNFMDSSAILELMSEVSQVPPTQVSVGKVSEISLNQAGEPVPDKPTKYKPRFAEFKCSHREVSRFAIAVTSTVIPNAFWGSDHNYQQIKKRIESFVSARRYETPTLHTICQNLRFPDFEWSLAALQNVKSAQRCLSDAQKGRELVEEFLYWYFDSFLVPLLKTTFYCTESAAFKNQVLFFRQDDWKHLCQPLLDRLCSTTFEKLPQDMAGTSLENRQLGFSYFRLLPKETGVRPIVNLRRKPNDGKEGAGISINQILQAAFQVLSFERDRERTLQGAAINGHTDVYVKLKSFKQRHVSPDGKLPKLYFVKVDVQACFDSIEQGKLLEIIRRIMKEDAYTIQRYTRLLPNAGRVKKQFCRSAVPDDEHSHFLTVASELAASLRHTIFTDQVAYPREDREALLALMEEHITFNVVKIGKDFHKQRVGIPQGSILSTILCNFFYGDLENSSGFEFTKNLSNLLLRYVDDYLFITTELEYAKGFLNMMNKGHPEYGCFISREKTQTNFEHDEPTLSPPCSQEITWCGLRIYIHSLNVAMDCSRFEQGDLVDSLTVEKGKAPGSSFTYKVLRMARMRSHILFTDTNFNSFFTVHLNIYENFLITAMKVVQYVLEWGVDVTKAHGFLRDTVRQAIMYSYASLKNRACDLWVQRHHGKCEVKKTEVFWLGFHAFEYVLSRKRTRLRPLYLCVREEAHRPKYAALRRGGKFESVIRSGVERFKRIEF